MPLLYFGRFGVDLCTKHRRHAKKYPKICCRTSSKPHVLIVLWVRLELGNGIAPRRSSRTSPDRDLNAVFLKGGGVITVGVDCIK